MLITFVACFSLLSCGVMLAAYHTWLNAEKFNAQAENYLRAANERLYAADKMMKHSNIERKQVVGGGKVLKFDRSHLKSVPREEGPSAA
jgi:hypothetical protein